jgi:UDP-N-acetylglucosamine--N-acetylmuramyl-(pentapeptide) pyrophosphoryl-undecaprenol N-acetylglucosamine transferase
MAGGTGGHVMPGLAVAQVMRERAWNVVWLGNPQGMEATLVPQHGITLEPVRIGGLRGKGLLNALVMPVRLARACWQSLSALRRIRPAVVLGMGGYVAFPGGLMAALVGYPLVVHEQNSVAGLTNRLLARLADRVLGMHGQSGARRPGSRRFAAGAVSGAKRPAAPSGGGR